MAEEDEIPSDWQGYLKKYAFPYPQIAEHLAKILKNPQEAHPRWFCKKVCNIAMSYDLEQIRSYEDVRDVDMSFGDHD